MRDRWTTWANSLAARHERFTARQGLLVMTLLEPLRLSVSINQRLESFAFALFPKIRVSIGPILNELGWSEFSSVSSGSSLRFSPAFRMLRTQETRTISRVLAGEKSYPNDHSINLGTRVYEPRMTRIYVHEAPESNVVLDQTRIQTLIRNFSQSPVRRVFARFEERDPGVVLRKLLFENESRQVVQRVFREHSRVEQRTRSDIVMRTQTKPAAVVEDRRRELEAQFASASKTRGPSWPEKPPEINVEQLTEQVIRRIDHRIIAYRERLGRAF
jgi:hypothetical protein